MSKPALLLIEQMEQSLARGAADPDPAVKVQMTVAAASALAADRHDDGPGEAAPQLLESLVGAAVSGDPRARERLLAEIHTLVLRYCRARLGGHETAIGSADDVAQEVCLTVINALPDYALRGRSFRAFIYGIAAHKVTDAYRATGRNRTEPMVDLLGAHTDAHNVPEQRLLAREVTERLGVLLHRLSPGQREVLVLRIAIGLSAEETALVVGSTPGAVRVTQHRALGRLRRMAIASEDVNDELDDQPASLPARVDATNAADDSDSGLTGDLYLDDLLQQGDRRLREIISAQGAEYGPWETSTPAPDASRQGSGSSEEDMGDPYIDSLLRTADDHLRYKMRSDGSGVLNTESG